MWIAWHGSIGGGTNRRIINLDFFACPRNETQREAMLARGKGHALGRDQPVLRRWPWNYSQEWLSNPEGSPVRAGWIRQLRELGTDADGLGYFDGVHVVEGNGLIPELERVERARERRLAAEAPRPRL